MLTTSIPFTVCVGGTFGYFSGRLVNQPPVLKWEPLLVVGCASGASKPTKGGKVFWLNSLTKYLCSGTTVTCGSFGGKDYNLIKNKSQHLGT